MGIKDLFRKAADYIDETRKLNKAYYEESNSENKEADMSIAEGEVIVYKNDVPNEPIICTRCGKRSNIGDKFCYDCGTPFGQLIDLEKTNENYAQHRKSIDEHFNSKYDFNSIQEIDKIPVKSYFYRDDITGNIAYVLRMRAGVHAANKRMDLAIACLQKAQDIMPISGITWAEKDYMRLVRYLIRDCQFDEARREWDRIRNNKRGITTASASHKAAFDTVLKMCRDLKTDLVKMGEHDETCAECSKYQGRVYSISGKDNRFPRLPVQVFSYGGIHEGCSHLFSPFSEKYNELFKGTFIGFIAWKKSLSPIEYSNRPFKDYRTPDETKKYEQWKSNMEKRPEYNEEWFEREKAKALERRLYETLCEHLPNLAPKSFGGYMRMKNAKTKNYIALAAAANEIGIEI